MTVERSTMPDLPPPYRWLARRSVDRTSVRVDIVTDSDNGRGDWVVASLSVSVPATRIGLRQAILVGAWRLWESSSEMLSASSDLHIKII